MLESEVRTYEKHANSHSELIELQTEMAILRRVEHPNVVEVLGFNDSENTRNGVGTETRNGAECGNGVGTKAGNVAGTLLLSYVAGPTLDQAQLNIENLVKVMCSLAATVAYLHQQGVVHGALTTKHVIISGNQRPVICGFSQAQFVESPGSETAEDVRAMGNMLETLARPTVQTIRARLERPELKTEIELRRAILSTASKAKAENQHERPSALELANLLSENTSKWMRINETRPQSSSDNEHNQWFKRSLFHVKKATKQTLASLNVLYDFIRTRISIYRIAIPALLVIILGIGILGTSGTLGIFSTSNNHLTDASAEICSPTTANDSSIDIDGDGCLETVSIDQGVVEVDSERYTVGAPMDVITLGRWNCENQFTIGLLRHDSGDVFIFDEWPTSGADTPARHVGSVPDGIKLEAIPRPSGQDNLNPDNSNPNNLTPNNLTPDNLNPDNQCDVALVTTSTGETIEMDPKKTS